MVASTGGHLKQLERLAERLEGVGDELVWVTFQTIQSQTLLTGRELVFARHTHSRDVLGTAREQICRALAAAASPDAMGREVESPPPPRNQGTLFP